MLDRLEIRKLSADLPADERTLRKELREPGSVRGLVGVRIRRALAERGIQAHPNAATSSSASDERR
jgi:hypothetical protein